MNIRFLYQLAGRLSAWPHLLLAMHLIMLHALAFGGWQIPEVRLLWLVALGVFLIWQPFIAGEQKITPFQAGMLFMAVLCSTWFLGPWLLLIWCGALAAAIGGRVLWTERRGERWGYLIGFGYLVCVTVFGVVPEIAPAVVLDPLPRTLFSHFMPMLLPLMFIFPARSPSRRSGDAFDLFYGMLVFLVLAVFVLGALAYMMVGQVGYVESLAKTSLTVAVALLLVGWAWNPRSGFSGIGSAISRYLLSVGMPLEQWLVELAEESEREIDPQRFLDAAMKRLQGIPWVLGGVWRADGQKGDFGEQTAFIHSYQAEDLLLVICFRKEPSPAMRWHTQMLLHLMAEFYLVKRQAHQLQHLGYLRAVYETGARVTHDVKNLVQSMQTLCYTATQPTDPAQLAVLLNRQLPQIVERLKLTLEKLQSPKGVDGEMVDAVCWWQRLQERYANCDLDWSGCGQSGCMLPLTLYDSVAENLLQNALRKRQHETALQIDVSFDGEILSVTDDGSAISDPIAERLFSAPVKSEGGLGIGLFHAARQADRAGYVLQLRENRMGRVAFWLSSKPPTNSTDGVDSSVVQPVDRR